MNRHLLDLILFVFIVGILKSAIGFKWVPIRQGYTLPKTAIRIDEDSTTNSMFVGRVKHNNEILPAQVNQFGEATFLADDYYQITNKAEILTKSPCEQCKWKSYFYSEDYFKEIDENIVRGGFDHLGEPIFIGRSYIVNGKKNITSIYNLQITQRWSAAPEDSAEYWQYLACYSETNKWIDYYPDKKLPNIKIYGDKLEYGYDLFVARLKQTDDNHVTGYVIPEKGSVVFMADENREPGAPVNSSICQVLVGERHNFSWVLVKNGQIPDYAVVNGKLNSELAYVARVSKTTIKRMTQSEAREWKPNFWILVENYF